jgi:HEAT repeat protein
VARTRRISTATATAAAIWAASAGLTVTLWPRAVAAQAVPSATAPAAPDRSPVERAAAEIKALAEALESPDPNPRRDEAARRLALRGSAGGNDVLARVIRGNNGKDAKIAALRGIASHPSPPPDLIAPIAALLLDRNNPSVNEAAADALAAYRDDPRALTALADSARDDTQPLLSRTYAIRALSRIPDPRAAVALVGLLGDSRALIRNAAIDALEELTGRHDIGADVASWRRWQQQNANKQVAQWKADILNARAAVQDDLRRRNQELTTELSNRLAQAFNAANPQQKPIVLLDMLKSPVAGVRAIGADLVVKDFARRLVPPTPELRDRLIDAIGDSDRDVRLQAAKTLYDLNEFGAYDALLAQLPSERDENVRVLQLRLLGRLEIDPKNTRIRSVILIRSLLSDSSLLVQKAAADAIQQFGPALVKQDAVLKARQAQDLSQELSKVIARPAREPEAADVRNSSIAALGALKSPIILNLAPQLLKRNESKPTRAAIVHALGELGDPHGGDIIAGWLPQEEDKAVRYEALIALGRTSGLERLDTFLAAMDPRQEPDESVRTCARDVIVSLLPNASEEQLTRVAQAFKDKDREMRVAILIALATRLEQRGEVESLAIQRESIGGDLLELGKPGEAVPFLQKAIDYYEKQNAGGLGMEKLIGRLTTALLQSKQFPQAADFASRTLKRDPSQMQAFGRMLKDDADRLKEAGKPDDAIALIDAVMKMNPPLDNRYLSQLREIRAQAEQRRPKSPASLPASQAQSQPAVPAPPQ